MIRVGKKPNLGTQLVQLWYFGIADVLAIVLVMALGWPKVASQLLADTGTAWHLRLGEAMLTTRQLPYTDTFTVLGAGRSWIDWSWASDLAFAVCMRWGGLHAVCMLSIAAETLFVGVLWRLVARRCNNVCVCVILCVSVAGLSFVHLLARPHIWAWTLCLWAYDALDKRATQPDWNPARLLVIFALWANIHPSFVFGLALALVVIAGQWVWGRLGTYPEPHLTLKRSCALALALSATSLCTPYGIDVHAQLFAVLERTELLAIIDGFRSLDLHTALGGLYVAMVLVGLWVMGRIAQPIWRLWTFSLAAYVGLLAQRNIPFGAALMAVSMAESLDGLWSGWRVAKRRFGLPRMLEFGGSFIQNTQDRRVHIWAWLVLLGVMAAARQTQHTDAYDMPKRALIMPFTQMLVEYGVTKGVLCNAQFGGALGFASNGRIRPMLDDRYELATDSELLALQHVLAGLHNWQLYLSQYKIDWVLLEADEALGELLASTTHWHVAQVHAGLTLWHRDLTLER